MFTLTFRAAALGRAIKTFCQSAIVMITAETTSLLDIDYAAVASVAGMSALLSILTSIASDAITGGTCPSLANEATKCRYAK